jgi:hypothetical protein
MIPLGSPLDFVALHGIHWIARVALRVQPPLRAKRTVDRIARGLRPLRGVAEAHQAAQMLGGAGSCLSRAVAIASRLPGAHVVIGVDRWRSVRASAHAWVEVAGAPIGANEVNESAGEDYQEIARLPFTQSHPGPFGVR